MESEGWSKGLSRIFYTLTQDQLFADPNNLLTFLDNHDVTRIYTKLDLNFNKFKMALGLLLTTRGIPQIYYGTEILMDGSESDGHGQIRQDFPGGWKDDVVDVFNRKNLTNDQIQALDFTKKILNWRKNNKVVQTGKLMHFIPESGVYVYFRYDDNQTVMVIVNSQNTKTIKTKRYQERMTGFQSATDIITGQKITDLSAIKLQGKSVMILELNK
jgi:glycosidase